MNLLFDTCVLSELVKQNSDPRVMNTIHRHQNDAFVSVFTMAEIEKGVCLLPDGARRNNLMKWYQNVALEYEARILSADLEIAGFWARLTAQMQKKGRYLPIIDGFIAATALAHSLTLVTRNVKDFEDTGVRILNPWDD